jgi:serine/threonine protein kinase
MAPEILDVSEGRHSKASTKSDIFSFGRVVHFVATGHVFMDREPDQAIIKVLLTKQLPELLWPQDPSPFLQMCRDVSKTCVVVDVDARPDIQQVSSLISSWGVIWSHGDEDQNSVPWKQGLLAILQPSEALGSDQRTAKGTFTAPSTSSASVTLHEPESLEADVPRRPTFTAERFPETPMAIKVVMLVEVLERWVIPLGVGPVCCDLHSMLEDVTKVIQEIRRKPCHAITFYRSKVQCPSCSALMRDVSEDDERACAPRICDVCEWEGSPRFDSGSGVNCRASL